jgi:RNA ligase (TIGR02306 family)
MKPKKGTLRGNNGNRIKPLKLRGVFSEGILYPVEEQVPSKAIRNAIYAMGCDEKMDHYVMHLGDDASSILGITKWEPPIPAHMAGEVAYVSNAALKYNFDRWESVPDIFDPGELVVATEKLHGTLMCVQYLPGMNHPDMFLDHTGCRSITVSSKGLGSQGLVFKDNDANSNNIYVQTLRNLLSDLNISKLMHNMSNANGRPQPVAILGEVFGKGIQDLDYNLAKPEFQVFDMRIGNEWLSPADMSHWGRDLPRVPVLYTGPFGLNSIETVRDGMSTIGGLHVREGVVVRSLAPREHPVHGRRIAKFISPSYLLRKVRGGGEATEYH